MHSNELTIPKLTFKRFPAVSLVLKKPDMAVKKNIHELSHKSIKCCVDGFSRQEVNNRTQMKR